MPPIRMLVLVALALSIFFQGTLLMLGGVAIDNNLPVPNNITSQYRLIVGNQTSASSLMGSISPISQQSGTQSKIISSTNFSSGLYGTTQLSGNFFLTMGSAWSTYINFIGSGLSMVGIPVSWAQTIALIMIIILVVLALLSAIFLFPL